MSERLQRNAASKVQAEHDGEPWSNEELDWLRSWDGSAGYLEELAGLLGRTIEACREQFYKDRRSGHTTRITVSTTVTIFRGWTEADGGWDD